MRLLTADERDWVGPIVTGPGGDLRGHAARCAGQLTRSSLVTEVHGSQGALGGSS